MRVMDQFTITKEKKLGLVNLMLQKNYKNIMNQEGKKYCHFARFELERKLADVSETGGHFEMS